jgi:hypothetical protein
VIVDGAPPPVPRAPPLAAAPGLPMLFPLIDPPIAAILTLDDASGSSRCDDTGDRCDGAADRSPNSSTARFRVTTTATTAAALEEVAAEAAAAAAASGSPATDAVPEDGARRRIKLVCAALGCDESMMMMVQQQLRHRRPQPLPHCAERTTTVAVPEGSNLPSKEADEAEASEAGSESQGSAARATTAGEAGSRRGCSPGLHDDNDDFDVDVDDDDADDDVSLLFRALGRLHHHQYAAPEHVAALLVATNWLETVVQEAVQQRQQRIQRRGRNSSSQAPILSRMLLELQTIEAVTDSAGRKDQASESGPQRFDASSSGRTGGYGSDLLSDLLLPHDGGLNLRNLVWHGFVGSIGRPWLSLVLVLVRRLRSQQNRAAAPALTIQDDETRSSNTSKKTSSQTTRAAAASTVSSSLGSFERKVPVSVVLDQLPPTWRVRADLGSMLAVAAAATAPAQERQQQQQQQQPGMDQRQTWPPTWDVTCRAIEAWMPTPQHVELWTVARRWIETAPSPPPPPPRRGEKSTPLTLDPFRQIGALERGQGDHRPLGIICAVLVVLLEAGLRQAFCVANPQRMGRDNVARPGAYYVTLDGHGQRDRHELLLQPYLLESASTSRDHCTGTSNGTTRSVQNRLLDRLGASRTSFLTDLFVSPYGPNLRAALSHGSWNARFAEDVRRLAAVPSPSRVSDGNAGEGYGSGGGMSDVAVPTTSTSSVQSNEEALDSMEAILSALCCCAIAGDHRGVDDEEHHRDVYLPQCSFTANVLAALCQIQLERGTIESILHSSELSTLSEPREFESLTDALLPERFERMIQQLRPRSLDSTVWTLDLLYREYDTNRALGPAVATRALASDLADFMTRFRAFLQTAASDESEDTTRSSRQRKTGIRLLACANDLNHFASFACLVALSSLEGTVGSYPLQSLQSKEKPPPNCHEGSRLDRLTDQEKVKLVERTRMVVSTVSTFITTNTDRAFKAIEDYSRSKLVKKFITNNN